MLALALALALSGALPAPTVPAAALENPAAPEPIEASEAPVHRHVASWVLLGAGAAGLLTGGALNLAAVTAANGAPAAVQSGVPVGPPQATGLWTGALVSYGIGAALGLAGAIAYYVESRR